MDYPVFSPTIGRSPLGEASGEGGKTASAPAFSPTTWLLPKGCPDCACSSGRGARWRRRQELICHFSSTGHLFRCCKQLRGSPLGEAGLWRRKAEAHPISPPSTPGSFSRCSRWLGGEIGWASPFLLHSPAPPKGLPRSCLQQRRRGPVEEK